MKKIGLGLVLGAVGFSNALHTPQEDGASIKINWSNNKGEKKVFKIDDYEKELPHEKIHSKTLLQQYVRTTCRPNCSVSRSGSCKSRSCSGGNNYYHSGRSCSGGNNSYHSGRSCSGVRSGSYGDEYYREPIVIQHKPVFRKQYVYKPVGRQNRNFARNNYVRSHSRDRSNVQCYNKDYDKKLNQVRCNDVQRLLALNKNNDCKKECERKSTDKFRKNNESSNYLKDQNKESLKNTKERSCSRQNARKFKQTQADKICKQKNKDAERCNENESKNSHNFVDLNHKKNEGLCMKEKDKDNLHSNDRCIEEFDKLEHFKKIEERCRSASKAKHSRVKKNECCDKNQKANNGESNKECRTNNKKKTNLNNECSDFKNKEKESSNRDSKYYKDDYENNNSCDKEREFEAKKAKETCSDDSLKNSHGVCNSFDLNKNKVQCDKNGKELYCNDDESGLKACQARGSSHACEEDLCSDIDH